MRFPIQITFRELPPSEILEDAIRRRAEDLHRYCDRITHCRVTVTAPSPHHRHGQQYRITVEVAVPGRDIVATHDPNPQVVDGSALVAIRDAFHAVRRELTSYVGRQREHIRHGVRIGETLAKLSPA